MTIQRVALGSVTEKVDYGLTASATERNTGIKFLRITDIQNDDVDWLEVPYCDCTPEEAQQHQLRAGDIVFARTGATTGKSHLVDELPDGAVFASYLIRVRPKSNVLDPAFLSYFFRTSDYWQQISGSAVGAAQLGFNATKLKQLVVPLPPLSEQQRIAEVLSKADRLRRLRRTARELSDTYLQSVFLEMFGDPVSNPMGWESDQLEDLVAEGKIITYGIVQAGPHIEDGIPYIRSGDIKNGQILTNDLLRTSREIASSYKRSEVHTGDFVFSIRASVGAVAEVPPTLNGANLTQGTARISPGPRVLRKYLLYALQTDGFQEWVKHNTKGATFREITLAKLREAPMIVPPLPLQQQFAYVVHKFERLRVQQREAERQSEHLFQTLLHRAFQGEL